MKIWHLSRLIIVSKFWMRALTCGYSKSRTYLSYSTPPPLALNEMQKKRQNKWEGRRRLREKRFSMGREEKPLFPHEHWGSPTHHLGSSHSVSLLWKTALVYLTLATWLSIITTRAPRGWRNPLCIYGNSKLEFKLELRWLFHITVWKCRVYWCRSSSHSLFCSDQ